MMKSPFTMAMIPWLTGSPMMMGLPFLILPGFPWNYMHHIMIILLDPAGQVQQLSMVSVITAHLDPKTMLIPGISVLLIMTLISVVL